MTPADEADDLISELGTAEVARRYGFDHGPRKYGPPSHARAKRDGENRAIVADALAQLERALAPKAQAERRAA